ncbi:MAG TPA: hypothetical protein VFW40_10480 [Capsulimonadaceae bacterium]|nr:hypothetical protein [Capsulimonadaceae bacterium]
MKKELLVGLFAILATAGLVGCGGGGGGGGGGGAGQTFTINGTVLNGDSSPAANVNVLFNDSSTVEATTDSSGGYTLTVPGGRVTGHDNLWITDSSANVLDVASIVVNTSPLTPTTTLPNSPPTLPGLFRHR